MRRRILGGGLFCCVDDDDEGDESGAVDCGGKGEDEGDGKEGERRQRAE